MNEAKLYWNDSSRSWTAKWKDEAANKWKMKRIPCEITHEDDANAWFNEWLKTELAKAPPPPPKPVPMTIDQLMQRWVKWLKELPGADPARWKDADACRRNWVVPYRFASVQAQDLQLSDCVDWIEDLERKTTVHNTLRNVVQCVRTMLSDARGKGWRDKENFFLDPYVKSRLRKAYGSSPKKPIIHLTLDDARKMSLFSGTTVPNRRHVRNLVALLTGLRASEMQGLKISDIDLNASVPKLKIDRQIVIRRSKPGAPFFKAPKKSSNRTIPIHSSLVPVFRDWVQKGWIEHVGRAPSSDDPVFPSSTGDWISDFRPTEFRLDLAAYGISPLFEGKEPITVHALRRTFLTLLTDAGVPDGDVKLLAGHKARDVTRNHYVGENLVRLQKGVESIVLAPPSQEAAA